MDLFVLEAGDLRMDLADVGERHKGSIEVEDWRTDSPELEDLHKDSVEEVLHKDSVEEIGCGNIAIQVRE